MINTYEEQLKEHQAREKSWGVFINFTPMSNDLTDDSLKLFLALANDAGNWNGMPMIGGNVCNTKAELGNLSDLKKRGLPEHPRGRGLFVCLLHASWC